MVGWPEQGASAAAPMDSGGKVAGVRHLGTTVRDSRSRAHREREENKANPSRGVLWLVGMANVAVRGGAMPVGSWPEHQGASNRLGNRRGESGDEGELTAVKNVGGGGSNRR